MKTLGIIAGILLAIICIAAAVIFGALLLLALGDFEIEDPNSHNNNHQNS